MKHIKNVLRVALVGVIFGFVGWYFLIIRPQVTITVTVTAPPTPIVTVQSATAVPQITRLPLPTVTSIVPTEQTSLSVNSFKLELGTEEKRSAIGLAYAPDTRTSYIAENGKFVFYLSAAVSGYRVEATSLDRLVSSPVRVLSATNKQVSGYGYQGYRGPGAVFKIPTGEVILIYHEEFWPGSGDSQHFPFTARIGIQISKDNGKTFSDLGPIIEGTEMAQAGDHVSGVGQPAAIIVGEDIYLYYIDWDNGDRIQLAKTSVANIHDTKSWKKWDGEGFNNPGIRGESTAVIQEDGTYTALPSVSWNKRLNAYLAVFETNSGFHIATSKDAIHWENYQSIMEFPQPMSDRQNGDTWYSYPTLLTLSTNDQFVTDTEGMLIYSKAVQPGAHHLYYRTFKLS